MKTSLNIVDLKDQTKAAVARFKSLGINGITHSQVMEAVAAMYGTKNRHEALDYIKSLEGEKPLKVSGSVSIIFDCFNTDTYAANVLMWFKVAVDQEFLDKVLELSKQAGTGVIEQPWEVQEYDTTHPGIHYVSLCVTSDSFWFKLSDKYENGQNENPQMGIEDLIYIATTGMIPCSPMHARSFYRFICAGTAVFVMGANEALAPDFILNLSRWGVLPESTLSEEQTKLRMVWHDVSSDDRSSCTVATVYSWDNEAVDVVRQWDGEGYFYDVFLADTGECLNEGFPFYNSLPRSLREWPVLLRAKIIDELILSKTF